MRSHKGMCCFFIAGNLRNPLKSEKTVSAFVSLYQLADRSVKIEREYSTSSRGNSGRHGDETRLQTCSCSVPTECYCQHSGSIVNKLLSTVNPTSALLHELHVYHKGQLTRLKCDLCYIQCIADMKHN